MDSSDGVAAPVRYTPICRHPSSINGGGLLADQDPHSGCIEQIWKQPKFHNPLILGLCLKSAFYFIYKESERLNNHRYKTLDPIVVFDLFDPENRRISVDNLSFQEIRRAIWANPSIFGKSYMLTCLFSNPNSNPLPRYIEYRKEVLDFLPRNQIAPILAQFDGHISASRIAAFFRNMKTAGLY